MLSYFEVGMYGNPIRTPHTSVHHTSRWTGQSYTQESRMNYSCGTPRHTRGPFYDPCVPYMPAVRVCVNVDTCGSRVFVFQNVFFLIYIGFEGVNPAMCIYFAPSECNAPNRYYSGDVNRRCCVTCMIFMAIGALLQTWGGGRVRRALEGVSTALEHSTNRRGRPQ